jgi:hypothetical protein
MDEGGKIVEMMGLDGSWNRTTLRDAEFICKVFENDKLTYIRKIEGSLDGGITWKEYYYEDELMLLGKEIALLMQWRVKGD